MTAEGVYQAATILQALLLQVYHRILSVLVMCRMEELAVRVELVSALWVSAKSGGSLPQCVDGLSITDCGQGETASCQCIMTDGLGVGLKKNKRHVVQGLVRADT